jgi:alpha-ketoglutarate-dependent taurine dioxygenase
MMGSFRIRKLGDTIGGEVTGLDAKRLAFDDHLAPSILEALEEYGVLVFPGLHFEPEAQVAFCRMLGPVDYSEGHHPVRGIYRVTLDTAKNSSAEYLKGTFDWHIDGCTPLDGEYPQLATLLSAVALSDTGGETEFASTYVAYERLSDEEKDRYGALRVVHSLAASQRRVTPHPSPEQLRRWRSRPESEHPLVWTHRSGRHTLVLGASADHVVGMSPQEGRALLDELLARVTAPGLVYRHRWSVGDTVIWDNRGVVHRAAPYDPASARELLRTTICGDEPIQ